MAITPVTVHAVGGDRGEQVVDGVGRVDEDALAGRPVADGVHEVDHLGGERVVDGEVATAEQLAEVQPILAGRRGGRHSVRTLRWPREQSAAARTSRAGQPIVVGGDRFVTVDDELAAAFRAGDRLVVVADTGDLLHIPAAEQAIATAAVDAAVEAFAALGAVADEQITAFFGAFADRSADDAAVAPILAANRRDVAAATAAGDRRPASCWRRRMLDDMVAGLRGWQRLAAASRRRPRRRSTTTGGPSRPAARRSASSASCSRVVPTSSPTPPAWCAPATRW